MTTKPSLGFVGAGRVGQALVLAFSQRGYHILGIASRDASAAERLKEKAHAQSGGADASSFSKSTDVLFFAVPDQAIKGVCDGIAGKGGFRTKNGGRSPLKDVFAVYPNPMNRQTQVEYSLKAPGKVNLSVYDLEGRLVQRIVDAEQPAGVYHTAWDGRGQDGRTAPAGVYFFRLSMPDKTKTARVVMIH